LLRIGKEYKFRKVRVVPLNEALDIHLKTRQLHYATLDVEGYEYPLLKALRNDGEFQGELFMLA
jgi:hypothetical protein